MTESITITDNRTGESVELPILNGGVDSGGWAKLLGNVWFSDDAFSHTAIGESSITQIVGAEGILRYRGYPIEQLARRSTYLEVAYLLLFGELPTPDQFDDWQSEITPPHVHSRELPQALHGVVPLQRPPHGRSRLLDRGAVDLLPRGQGRGGSRGADAPDRAPHRQGSHHGRRGAPLLHRHALRVPGQRLGLHVQLPVDDVPGGRAPLPLPSGGPPGARDPVHPARRSQPELLHHRCPGRQQRARRSLLGGGRRLRRSLRAASRRCKRGGPGHAARDRQLRERGARTSPTSRPASTA